MIFSYCLRSKNNARNLSACSNGTLSSPCHQQAVISSRLLGHLRALITSSTDDVIVLLHAEAVGTEKTTDQPTLRGKPLLKVEPLPRNADGADQLPLAEVHSLEWHSISRGASGRRQHTGTPPPSQLRELRTT